MCVAPVPIHWQHLAVSSFVSLRKYLVFIFFSPSVFLKPNGFFFNLLMDKLLNPVSLVSRLVTWLVLSDTCIQNHCKALACVQLPQWSWETQELIQSHPKCTGTATLPHPGCPHLAQVTWTRLLTWQHPV